MSKSTGERARSSVREPFILFFYFISLVRSRETSVSLSLSHA